MTFEYVGWGVFGRLSAFALAVLCLFAAAGGLKAPGAEAKVPTKLNLLPSAQGVFGYVESRTPKRCAAGREVSVFAVTGNGRRRSLRIVGRVAARKITGKGTAARGAYQWKLRTRSKRRLLARVAANKRCRAAKSGVGRVVPRHRSGKVDLGDVPQCPSMESYCRLDTLHFDTGICPSFTGWGGKCRGSIDGPSPWWANSGEFHWWDTHGGFRRISLSGSSPSDKEVRVWDIFGTSPGAERAEFNIDDAWTSKWANPDTHWRTADLSIPAGKLGGPLYLNFENGFIGADAYVHGYLYRTK